MIAALTGCGEYDYPIWEGPGATDVVIDVENANGDVVSYTYDAFGNKTSMTYPGGQTVSYEYDSMNRMTAVVGLFRRV